jgi:long-chain acyl-CoA synthetase
MSKNGNTWYAAREAEMLRPLDPALDTVPKNFLAKATQYGASKIAMRKKRLGIWQEYTWAESLAHVRDFCLGLVCLGLKPGDKVALIGDNDPEYYWAELAVQSAGGTTIGVFTDVSPQELHYVLSDSDSVFVIAHDQEQCDKMLELRAQAPQVRNVIYWDERGLWNYSNPWLLSFQHVEEKGREYAMQPGRSNAFEELIRAGKGDDIAILSYTSGTTSLPKGAMISHSNLIYGARHVLIIAPFLETDNYVSFSPLAWITEQALGLTPHVTVGTVVNVPERRETVQATSGRSRLRRCCSQPALGGTAQHGAGAAE